MENAAVSLPCPAFGVYLHWPFCVSKCPYCDFNSSVADSVDPAAWQRALLAELDHYAALTAGRQVDSIFFGGGTPSLMPPALVGALLEGIAARWPLAPDVEITLEANPGTIDAARFRDFRAAGINRLSMGLQALNDPDLKFLGRRHDAATARQAVSLARAIFPRLSFDLIYARPGQERAAWAAELREAIAMTVDHLSVYQLTIEDGTAFAPAHARGDFILPDEDLAAALFDDTQEICAAAGLPAYEVSNHAAAGAECRHNLLYWQGGDYLGIGPGAHGRLTDPEGTVWALAQRRAAPLWLETTLQHGHATKTRTALTADQRCAELLMMGLRLVEGLPAARFAARAGQSLASALDPDGVRAMTEDGFVTWDGTTLQATPSGRLVLNSVIAALLPTAEGSA